MSESKVKIPGLPNPDPLPCVSFMPTGFPALDEALGGGINLGKVTHLYGRPDIGKSTFAAYIGALFQQTFPDRMVYMIETERHFNPDRVRRLGLNVDDKERFRYYQRSTAEEVANLVSTIMEHGSKDLVLLDTIGNIALNEDITGSKFGLDSSGNFKEHGKVAGTSGVFTRLFKKVAHDQTNSEVTLILNNQLRDTIGTYGGPTKHTPGGNVLHYNVTCGVQFRKSELLMEGLTPVGLEIAMRVERAKYGIAPRSLVAGEYPIIYFDDAIEKAKSAMMYSRGIMLGVIEKNKAWFKVIHPETGEELYKVQGEAKMRQLLNENVDVQQLIEGMVSPRTK